MLARASGSQKLVGGQMQDLLSEGTMPDESTLSYIHSNKTAVMIETALKMGFRMGSQGVNREKLSIIGKAGHFLGLAFQAVDDLLDVTKTSLELGKDAHQDDESGKVTWVSLKGLDEAHRLAEEHSNNAIQTLDSVGGDTNFLCELIYFMLKRKF